MTLKGWGNIEYNFDPQNSIAAFYGCCSAQFAEKFMGITNVRYTAGNPGRAGGTFKYSGPFNGTVLNNLWGSDPFNRDVYLRSSENGKVLPMFLYERGKSSYNRITGGQSLIEIECYTNPTVK